MDLHFFWKLHPSLQIPALFVFAVSAPVLWEISIGVAYGYNPFKYHNVVQIASWSIPYVPFFIIVAMPFIGLIAFASFLTNHEPLANRIAKTALVQYVQSGRRQMLMALACLVMFCWLCMTIITQEMLGSWLGAVIFVTLWFMGAAGIIYLTRNAKGDWPVLLILAPFIVVGISAMGFKWAQEHLLIIREKGPNAHVIFTNGEKRNVHLLRDLPGLYLIWEDDAVSIWTLNNVEQVINRPLEGD